MRRLCFKSIYWTVSKHCEQDSKSQARHSTVTNYKNFLKYLIIIVKKNICQLLGHQLKTARNLNARIKVRLHTTINRTDPRPCRMLWVDNAARWRWQTSPIATLPDTAIDRTVTTWTELSCSVIYNISLVKVSSWNNAGPKMVGPYWNFREQSLHLTELQYTVFSLNKIKPSWSNVHGWELKRVDESHALLQETFFKL